MALLLVSIFDSLAATSRNDSVFDFDMKNLVIGVVIDTATFQILLDGIPCGLDIIVVVVLRQSVRERFLKVVQSLRVSIDGSDDKDDEENESEDEVNSQHAAVFLHGSAAAEEGDDDYESAHDNDEEDAGGELFQQAVIHVREKIGEAIAIKVRV